MDEERLLEQHREIFQKEYLDTYGSNCSLLKRQAYDKIKCYFQASLSSMERKLLKRIRNANMHCVVFPGGRGEPVVRNLEEPVVGGQQQQTKLLEQIILIILISFL